MAATTYVTASNQGAVEFVKLFGSTVTSGTWSELRNSTTGSSATMIEITKAQSTIEARNQGPARGTYPATISRLFLHFNSGSVLPPGATVTDLELKLYGTGSEAGGDSIVVKSKLNGGFDFIATENFDSLYFATPYSSELPIWSNSGFNTYTLNATAISDFTTNNYLDVVVIEHDYDYSNSLPSEGTIDTFTTQHLDVRLSITYSTTGWGNNINGVLNANIVSVIGVAKASIANVNGT